MTKVVSVMSKHLVELSLDTTAETALEILDRERVHHALVVTHGDMNGVVCRCDLENVPPTDRVGHCVKRNFVFIDDHTSGKEAAEIMQRWGIGFLPVIGSSGKLSGVVTRRDLRQAGFLPNQPGVDRCVSCGDTHSLTPVADEWTLTFCKNCMEAPTNPGGVYLTLGGSD
jgi:CBS-domain-containing membrane protein